MRKMTADERKRHESLVVYIAKFPNYLEKINLAMVGIREEAFAAGLRQEFMELYRRKLVADVELYRGMR